VNVVFVQIAQNGVAFPIDSNDTEHDERPPIDLVS
jgi:hypothetical protein